MKYLKRLFNETFGELIDDIKETVDDIKSELTQPFTEIVDEFRDMGFNLHRGNDDDDSENHASSNKNRRNNTETITSKRTMKVTIKGVYQMNGPKPFTREITCSSSEVGYYSQLMGNKSKQAQWISANFPGADTTRGFSMSVNIK